MDMEASVECVIHEVVQKTTKAQRTINKLVFTDDSEHNDYVIDVINAFKSRINKINDSYLKLFETIDHLFMFDKIDAEHVDDIKEIVLGLKQSKAKSAMNFSRLEKIPSIKAGCRGSLLDLRINLSTLQEYISDIENKYLSDRTEFNEKMNALLSSF